MEDKAIIKLFNQRREEALERTREQYGAYCHSIAMRILENREDAEECLNDTLLRVWNTIPPKQPSSLAAYLGKIIRNLALDRYRRRHTQKNTEFSAVLEELAVYFQSDPDPETLFIDQEISFHINQFLKTLPKRERIILLGRYYYVYPLKDIAQKLGISYPSCKMALSRSLQKLKEYLEKENLL